VTSQPSPFLPPSRIRHLSSTPVNCSLTRVKAINAVYAYLPAHHHIQPFPLKQKEGAREGGLTVKKNKKGSLFSDFSTPLEEGIPTLCFFNPKSNRNLDPDPTRTFPTIVSAITDHFPAARDRETRPPILFL
jgi:hypothetical protein